MSLTTPKDVHLQKQFFKENIKKVFKKNSDIYIFLVKNSDKDKLLYSMVGKFISYKESSGSLYHKWARFNLGYIDCLIKEIQLKNNNYFNKSLWRCEFNPRINLNRKEGLIDFNNNIGFRFPIQCSECDNMPVYDNKLPIITFDEDYVFLKFKQIFIKETLYFSNNRNLLDKFIIDEF